jgi:hypothetical protein
MGREMARQLGALAIGDEHAVPSARCLIAHVDRNPAAKPPRELEVLCAKLTDAQLCVVQEDPFWKEILRFYQSAPNLFAVTLRWLEEQPQ